MDGSRVRSYLSREARSLLEIYEQFAELIAAHQVRGAAHRGEDGRFVEALVRALHRTTPNRSDERLALFALISR